MKNIIFVTGNEHKLKEARSILKNFTINKKKVDLPEIQSTSVEEVIKNKLDVGKKIMKSSKFFVEDTGLYIEKLNGFPGALIKFYYEHLKNDGISKQTGGSNCYAETIIGYYDGKNKYFFKGKINGKIAKNPKGNNGFGWDKIFIPKGYSKTFAELTDTEKNKLSMRKKAFENMKKKI